VIDQQKEVTIGKGRFLNIGSAAIDLLHNLKLLAGRISLY